MIIDVKLLTSLSKIWLAKHKQIRKIIKVLKKLLQAKS